MGVLLEMGVMGKGRPKKSKRNDGTAKIDVEILDMARIITATNKISMAEYLSELLREPIKRDYLKALKKLSGGEESR